MRFSLIICTYLRPQPLIALLHSVREQTLYPDQIIIVDGSFDNKTKGVIDKKTFKALEYHLVEEKDRGLTRQRNFGILKVERDIDIVCFLDDDIVLTLNYFETLISTYYKYPKALGVGGYIINEIHWKPVKTDSVINIRQFSFDGWVRNDGSRFVLRKRMGLDANKPPAQMPDFGHGRSVSFLPPSGKIYEVEQFMGGVASYQKNILDTQNFSDFFEGYGLYEDADYTLRLSQKGKLYVNTAARLYHYHGASGRPNKYKYGKMVVRNGWYVWRVKYPKPNLKSRFKWNATSLLLTLIRFTNVITTKKKKEAMTESLGRLSGWFSLIYNRPKLQ